MAGSGASAFAHEARPPWLGDGPLNPGGATGLRRAASAVTRIELRDVSTGKRKGELTQQECSRLKDLLRKGEASATPTVAPPPWPVVLVLRTRDGASFVAFPVGQASLRVNPRRPLDASVTPSSNKTPPSTELVLDDPDLWLWKLLESRLGPTQVKEYQVVTPPPSLRARPTPPAVPANGARREPAPGP